jgi:cytidylate kinase
MTNSPLILLISGWAGSGKDAAAALLVEEMGFQRFAFADSVKDICAHKYGIPLLHFHSSAKDGPLESHVHAWPHAHTPRDILIAHAAAARTKDNTVFARHVAHDIKQSDADRIVISDWRFLVEHTHLRETFPTAHVLTARIVRPGITQNNNSTEHELDGRVTDLVIANDGCISDLRDHLRALLRPYLHPSSAQSAASLIHEGS